jgi:hypothetical protein
MASIFLEKVEKTAVYAAETVLKKSRHLQKHTQNIPSNRKNRWRKRRKKGNF